MSRSENLGTFISELEFLGLFTGEEISRQELKEKGLGPEIAKNLLNLGYIEIKDIKDFPDCDYNLTAKGLAYVSDVLSFMTNYNQKK